MDESVIRELIDEFTEEELKTIIQKMKELIEEDS